jgi:hypothetical protein
MKTTELSVVLLIVAALTSCTSPQHAQDIHASPTSVVQAHFQALKDNNVDLILQTMAPASRPKMLAQMPKDPLAGANEMAKTHWGVPMSEVDPRKITLMPVEGRDNKKHVDALYNGKSCGDPATLITIDGKWYIERF